MGPGGQRGERMGRFKKIVHEEAHVERKSDRQEFQL